MPVYHLYCLRRGALVDALDVEAEDDAQAVRIAHARANCDRVEVWSDDRRLSTVETRGAPMFRESWRRNVRPPAIRADPELTD